MKNVEQRKLHNSNFQSRFVIWGQRCVWLSKSSICEWIVFVLFILLFLFFPIWFFFFSFSSWVILVHFDITDWSGPSWLIVCVFVRFANLSIFPTDQSRALLLSLRSHTIARLLWPVDVCGSLHTCYSFPLFRHENVRQVTRTHVPRRSE